RSGVSVPVATHDLTPPERLPRKKAVGTFGVGFSNQSSSPHAALTAREKAAMNVDVEQVYGWASQQESTSNRLNRIEFCKLTVSATEADIWLTVDVERVTPGTDVRGRIVGPRSLFTETTEVVSPLRSVRHNVEGQTALMARTAIPNPGFWEPGNPL